MLLIKMTVSGVDHYISNEYLAIERFYDAQVASMSQLRFATRNDYGGFAEPAYGEIELLPSVFVAAWPPPQSCPIKVSIAATGESDAGVIFEGIAHLQEVGRTGVIYSLFGPQITTTATDAVYSGTLNSVFLAACSTLGLTLNTTAARATSPTVEYTADGEQLLIDTLSDIAAFFTHRFYIEAGVLYLIDCLLDNGTLSLTEFDVFPSTYQYPSPISKITAQYSAEIDQFRMVFTANQGGGVVAFSEIEMRSVADGDDETTVTGGTATATNYYNSSFLPSYAVDNNNTTAWASLTGPAATLWWMFDFIANVKVIEYTIKARDVSFDQSPTSWLFQGYDIETATWRTISEEETDNDWTASELRKFSVSPPTWDVIVDGSHSYGELIDISPVCHTARAEIKVALGNIKTVLERMRVGLIKPLSGVPKIGQKITLTDESLLYPTTIWGRVSSIVWDFNQEQCVVIGEGALQ